jgi:putative CRISPR-associated protein (TIGR02619 family)
MSDRKLILSTVGISIFYNTLGSDEARWRQRLNEETNVPTLSDEVAAKVADLSQRALDVLRQDDVQRNRSMSAELNGLYGLYQDQLTAGRGDMHFLIATDTALGRQAADVIQTFLQEKGLKVDVYPPSGLSTATRRAFSNGIKALIHWCENTIPGYREAGYRVVFNLTGAFKSLQGYLNIVGMFYADEIVYIFETGQELLTIPRLPLQVDTEALRKHRVELALMAQGHVYGREQVADILDALLDIDQTDHATLSDWGALIWNRVRQDLLGDDLLPFPRLQFSDQFRRDFKRATATDRGALQECLAKVSSLLEDHQGDTSALKQDRGLQYDIYAGRIADDGRPIGHFRVSQSRRVSCTAEGGILHLRKYGEHEINDNP